MVIMVKNLYTDKVYEAIQYSPGNAKECKDFIRENKSATFAHILPDMRVYRLSDPNSFVEIHPTDFIIKTIGKKPAYKVVSQSIMENNFDILMQR